MPTERNFGLWFAAICATAGLWRFTVRPGWLIAAALFGVAAFGAPALLRPLNLVWHRFGLLLARIMNPIAMALVYAVAIVPIGLLWKLAGHDPLRRKLDPGAASYWIPRTAKPQSMSRQF